MTRLALVLLLAAPVEAFEVPALPAPMAEVLAVPGCDEWPPSLGCCRTICSYLVPSCLAEYGVSVSSPKKERRDTARFCRRFLEIACHSFGVAVCVFEEG